MFLRVDEQYLIQEFIKVAEIASPSYKERCLANYLIQRLESMGLEVEEDDAGEKIGGDCGNLIARLPGDEKLPAVFFCAHMDTVEPAVGVKVVFQDGVFRSRGDTILGGDDKAGIVAVLEAIQLLQKNSIPHGPLVIIFTVAEEQGLLGSKNLNTSRLGADFGYVLDSSGSPGTIIISAPAQTLLNITVKGKAAHAGIEPEKGINAIQVAGKALARLRLGRLDEETTANIGLIKGGKATNIVPEDVYIQGEVRSRQRGKIDKVVLEIAETFRKVTDEVGAKSRIEENLIYSEFFLDKELPVVKYAALAAKNMGLDVSFQTSGGGSDANIFNAAGIPTANLGIGMQQVHTREEFLELKDLVADVNWILEIIRVSADLEGEKL